ncbi:MAG: hypothetical protein ACRD10_15285, partial [Terriglobia bacterium]
MHSIGDFQDGKENSSLSAPGDKPLRGSDESQDARLTKRLEELEKQLGRLEGIGLSGSDPQETLAQVPGDPSRAGMHADVPRPEKGPRSPILVRQDQPVEKPTRESAAEAWQSNVRNPGPPPAMQQITVREPLARMDQLAERHPSALIDQLGVLQSQAIQEYRAEMARWLQVTVEETRCRLNSLANEIRCRLQAEMNESLGNLAGELAGQMAQSLQRDVETA